MFIGLISWIIVGLIVGFIASKNVKLHGDDPKLGVACGAVGAVTGGILYRIVAALCSDSASGAFCLHPWARSSWSRHGT